MTRSFVRSILVVLAIAIGAAVVVAVDAAPICAYSGPAKNLPLTSAKELDLKALGSPPYLRIIGCGGGGGGAGAQRAPNTGYAASGGGGAGAEVVSYLYGPTDGSTKLKVEFTSDGAGGCGGAQDHTHCPGLAPGKYAPDGGQPGRAGMTVKIGPYIFEGGEPGTWPAGGVSLGGRKAVAGGHGGYANISGPSGGSGTDTHKGGAAGASGYGPGGHGGIAGGGGGASLAGPGGQGGKAGAGDGKSTGAANNAGHGHDGAVCAGGGGGGGAAGGTFPGGNGGDGGEAWIVIFNIGNKLEYEGNTKAASEAEVAMLGYPCNYFKAKPSSRP